MALAILELLGYDNGNYHFSVDTGTNAYYQLRAGTSVRRDLGIELVEDRYFATPLARRDAGGDLLGSVAEMSIPARSLGRPKTYVQLLSFKSADHRSPAFSRAVPVPVGSPSAARRPDDYAASFSDHPAMSTNAYQTARSIPHQSAALAQQASMDELLGTILKIALPVVQDLLKGSTGGSGVSTPSVTALGSGNGTLADGIAQLLGAILGGAPAVAGQSMSQPQSLGDTARAVNRFTVPGGRYAKPFVFGVDDAVLAGLIGTAVSALAPVLEKVIGSAVQQLPQLANAANQRRIQLKQADNAFVGGILSDVNKRLMLDKLAEAQRQTQPEGAVSPEFLNQLAELLKRTQATAQPAVSGLATPQALQSSLFPIGRSYSLSNRAVLSFVTADPVSWNGTSTLLFSRNQEILLKVRLNVGEPVPGSPLPKAILRIVFKDSTNPAVSFEKTFKHKDVSAGAVMECRFLPGELAHIPANAPIAVMAEMRWLSARTGRESRALGSADIVLANKYFLQDRGGAIGEEIELRDMQLYRPFWNKIWEAPVLDARSEANGRKKYLWEIDMNARYSVLLSSSHESNGLMATKLLRGPVNEESLSERTEGRMKAGIELSVAELNKLLPLWGRGRSLDAERLEAFGAANFLKQNARELKTHLRMKGKAGQRGLIWVVPVFKLFGFKLSSAVRTDENGQIIATSEEEAHFPLPVAARVIGLKSLR